MTKQEFVTLYVWKLRADNPGHVSMQIGNTYISYWPPDAAGEKDVKVGQTHEPELIAELALHVILPS